MNYFNISIDIFSYILDMLIVTLFLSNILEGFKKNRVIPYLITLLFTEILLYLNSYIVIDVFLLKTISTILLSLTSTIFLCIFFKGSISEKILFSIIFQAMVSISEYLFTYLVTIINPDIFSSLQYNTLFTLMNLGSKTTLFIMCLFTIVLWRFFNKNIERLPIEYIILFLTTPIITILIYLTLPLQNLHNENSTFFLNIVTVGLAFLNITNYILINITYKNNLEKIKKNNLEKQIQFQKEKYNQLSDSYKQGRKIIHDAKKHTAIIQRYINEKKYDYLADYCRQYTSALESAYAKYNTGNLVIDTFISYYENLATNHNILFSASINININLINIDDYDLCIILGNLLDNAINACCKISDIHQKRFIIVNLYTTETKKFTIHIENSYNQLLSDTKTNSVEHGYGLLNIKDIVNKYHGFQTYSFNDNFVYNIMIPYIDKSFIS